VQRHDVQPIIEVLPEPALPHLRFKIAARGRDDLNVDLNRARAANASKALALERGEHPRLHRRIQVSDFTNEQDTAAGLLKQAMAHDPAFLDTEKIDRRSGGTQ